MSWLRECRPVRDGVVLSLAQLMLHLLVAVLHLSGTNRRLAPQCWPLRNVAGGRHQQLLPVGGGWRLNAHYVVVTSVVASAWIATCVLELVAPVALLGMRTSYSK